MNWVQPTLTFHPGEVVHYPLGSLEKPVTVYKTESCCVCRRKLLNRKRSQIRCRHKSPWKSICRVCSKQWFHKKTILHCFSPGCAGKFAPLEVLSAKDAAARKRWIKSLKDRQVDPEIEEEVKNGEAQLCPVCRTPIRKTGGCNMMSCAVCGTGFNYETGDPS